MIIRSLSANHDWQFGQGIQSYATDQNAIIENINTRLLSFKGNCFFDLGTAIDWFRLLGSKSTKQEIILNVRATILASYGVIRVNNIGINFQRNSRNIVLNYNCDTIFSKDTLQQVEILNA